MPPSPTARSSNARRWSPPATGRTPPGEPLHVVGLVGPGGVHAHDRHLLALVELAARRGVGSRPAARPARRSRHAAVVRARVRRRRWRRVSPRCIRTRRIATVGGRYYAMDRDHRWERVEAGYDAIVHGEAAHHAASATRGRSRPPTPAARPTSSSSRRSSARRRPIADHGADRPCELPRRPGAPARPRARRGRRVRRVRPHVARRPSAPRPTCSS